MTSSSKIGFGGGSWDSIDTAGIHELRRGKPVRVHGDARVTVPAFESRVLRGIALLNEVAPGWADNIETDRLDLNNRYSCVLGQTWPHYQRLHGLAERSRGLDLGNIYVRYSQRGLDLFNNTPFNDMLEAIAAPQDENQYDFGASIGCSMSGEDVQLANAQAKHLIIARMGEATATTEAGHRAMTELGTSLLALFYEELTKTWLRLIPECRRHQPVRDHRIITLDEMPQPSLSVEHARELLEV